MKYQQLLLPLSFLLLFPITYAWYAGSTYSFYLPRCEELNVSAICEAPIAENEYTFEDCQLVNLTTYQAFWSCSCSDNYYLKLHINPRASNNCTFTITSLYTTPITHTTKVTHEYHRFTIVENQTLNKTVILPEKIVEKPVYYENETKIQTYQEEIKYLQERIAELNEEIASYKEKMKGIRNTVIAVTIIIVCLIFFYYWFVLKPTLQVPVR